MTAGAAMTGNVLDLSSRTRSGIQCYAQHGLRVGVRNDRPRCDPNGTAERTGAAADDFWYSSMRKPSYPSAPQRAPQCYSK